MALRLRRGTDAERLLVTPLQGELIYATDTKKLYVGDGATLGGVLIGPSAADTFTELVDDASPQLGGDLDLNGNNITGVGNINIDGTITATGNIGLGDDTADVISVGGVINSNLNPAIDGVFNLGSGVRRWNKLWAEGATFSGQVDVEAISTGRIVSNSSGVVFDETTDTLAATNVNATTVTANLVGNVTGDLEGDITGTGTSTFAIAQITQADINSGTMDGVVIGGDGITPAANITGDQVRALGGFFGNVTGDVTGNINGDVTGSLTLSGNVFGGDSSVVIDGDTSTVLGDVNNQTTDTDFLIVNTRATVETLRIPGPLGGLSITTTGNADDDYSLFEINNFQNTTEPVALSYFRSRGTEAAPTAVSAGDGIVIMGFNAMGTNTVPGLSSFIQTSIDTNGTIGDGIVPGTITIGTTDDSGNPVEGLTLDKDGKISVAGNTLTAGVGSGQVDNSAAVSYLEITVGGTTYGLPLYAINP